RLSRRVELPNPPALAFANPLRAVPERSLPPGQREVLARIDADCAAALRSPAAQWRLEPIKRQYQELSRSQSDPSARAALEARAEQLDRLEEFARASERFEALIQRSRSRDAELAHLRERAVQPSALGAGSFDVIGRLQRSSKHVRGEAVFALVGSDGLTAAYLKVPPGIATGPLLARLVGVRGEARYEESLRAPLVEVQDLVPLGDAP
ncbi:MAG: hypothetical protein IRY99_23880, partial [Isosphaeraceae bacterium]|nr:hypothetical protein [Isosphaeraceae bacterium]